MTPTAQTIESGLRHKNWEVRFNWAKRLDWTPTPAQIERGLLIEKRLYNEREDFYIIDTHGSIDRMRKKVLYCEDFI